MQDFTKVTGFWRRPVPLWSHYLFALTLCALAWLAQICLTHWYSVPPVPFLLGFAAVIASATWAGLGPGLLSIAVISAWSTWMLSQESGLGAPGGVARAAIFVAEGLLVCICSARLRRATQRASRSEDWHRRIVETAAEGIWIIDEAGIVTYANPRIAEIIGVPVDALIGHPREEHFFPEDLSIERIRFDNRRAGMKEQFDRRLRRSDGAEAWVLTCSNTFWNPRTESLAVLSMMTDITERKNAEYALRRSEVQFRGLFENVLEGVYQSTPDGSIVAANPMLLRMLGLASAADLNDVNIAHDLYVDKALRGRLLEELEQEGSFQNVQYELRRRDGGNITVQENARVVRDQDGKVLYYEGTLTDITQNARMEAQLREARKSEALGLLANGIAHDFSNIVTVISGYAHLVLADLSPSHPAYLNGGHLVGAADSAAGLTSQLLSFSHREMDPAALTELNWVIREAEKPIHSFLNAQRSGAMGKVSLILSLHPGPLPVLAEAEHIRQILMHLTAAVRNCVAEGRGVRIGTAPAWGGAANLPGHARAPGDARAESHEYAIISVAEADPAPTLGEEFPAYPTDDSGVAASRAILARYGGFLTVECQPTSGLTYSVYLPALALSAEHA